MEVKEIITLDDISTYPKKIVEYIENHEIEQFPKLPDDLLEYMDNLYCSVYHCTRLEDVEIIKDKGLLVPKENKELQEHYIRTLEKFYSNSDCDFRQLIYNYDYSNNHRGNEIWFAMPYTDMFKDTGCRTFLKYWGGELIEFVLKQAGLGKEWEKISEIGKPYIIKAKIGFFEIDTTGRYEKLMYIMSSWYKKRMSVGGTEGFVKRNIKPNEILEIIDGSNTLEKLDKMYYELMKS